MINNKVNGHTHFSGLKNVCCNIRSESLVKKFLKLHDIWSKM